MNLTIRDKLRGMDEMSADDARRNWSDLLHRAHWKENVGITLNGKPWAVVVSRDWYGMAEASLAGRTTTTVTGPPLRGTLPDGRILEQHFGDRMATDADLPRPEDEEQQR